MIATVWIEVMPTRRNWQGWPSDLKVGRRWVKRPTDDRLAPGAICVEVVLDIPVERLMNVVRAVVPHAAPVTVA